MGETNLIECVFLTESDGLHLAKVKIVSPVSSLLRMTLGQCYRLNSAHQERHLRQAHTLRHHADLPSS